MAFDPLDLHELTRSVGRGGDHLRLGAAAVRAVHGLKTTHQAASRVKLLLLAVTPIWPW